MTLPGRLAMAAAALTCVAFSALAPPPHGPALTLSSATGAITTSRPDTAILTAHDLRPGDSATGTIEVSNRHSTSVRLNLQSSPATDHPGTSGGRLSERLSMTVEALPHHTRIASGTLHELAGCHDLGPLGPGADRAFRFTVRFPRGRGDNSYAGASARVDERWTTSGCRGTEGAYAVAPDHHAADPSLPFTGLTLALLAATGAALTAAGIALRRRNRSRP